MQFLDITSKGHLPSAGRTAGFWDQSVGCNIRFLSEVGSRGEGAWDCSYRSIGEG